MRRDEVVAALRQAELHRREIKRLQGLVAPVDAALESMSEEERALLALVVDRRRGQVERLCQRLEVEPATVYRRRNKALRKLGERLGMEK